MIYRSSCKFSIEIYGLFRSALSASPGSIYRQKDEEVNKRKFTGDLILTYFGLHCTFRSNLAEAIEQNVKTLSIRSGYLVP
jgi:hypothetical protein